MRPGSSFFHLLLLSLLLGGCGKVTLDGADAGPGMDGGLEVDAMLPDLCTGDVALENAWQCTIDQVCGLLDECFGGAFTLEDCTQLNLQVFDIDASYGDILLGGAIAAGTIEYDGQELGQCLEAIGALTCETLFAGSDPFDVCRPFIGTVPVGGACVLDHECALPGSNCERPNCAGDDICCPGACSNVVPVGGTCDAMSGPCQPGAFCVAGTCMDGEPGSRCTADWDCDEDAFCSDQTCVADFAAGSQCTDDDQCARPTTCVGANAAGGQGICQRSSVTGDICDGSCNSFGGHYCDRPDNQSLGTCQPRLGEGQACQVELMPCELGLRCDSTTLKCASYGEPGAPCKNFTDCAYYKGTFCSTAIDDAQTGTCLTRLPDGATCNSDSHCVSSLCRDKVCTAVEACY